MHFESVAPGAWFETLYSAEPASLSLIATVPAANELPEFEVVPENAEKVAKPASEPRAATIPTVTRSFLWVVITNCLLWVPQRGMAEPVGSARRSRYRPPFGGRQTLDRVIVRPGGQRPSRSLES